MYCIFESYMIDLVIYIYIYIVIYIIKPCKGHSLFQWHSPGCLQGTRGQSFDKVHAICSNMHKYEYGHTDI